MSSPHTKRGESSSLTEVGGLVAIQEDNSSKTTSELSSSNGGTLLGEFTEISSTHTRRVGQFCYILPIIKGITFPLFKVALIALAEKLLRTALEDGVDPTLYVRLEDEIFEASASTTTDIFLLRGLTLGQAFAVTAGLVVVVALTLPLSKALHENYLNYREVKRLQGLLYEKFILEPNSVAIDEASDLLYTKINAVEQYWSQSKYKKVDDIATLATGLVLMLVLSWDLGLTVLLGTAMVFGVSTAIWMSLSTPWEQQRQTKTQKANSLLLDLVLCKEVVLSHAQEYQEQKRLNRLLEADQNDIQHLVRAKFLSDAVKTGTFTMVTPILFLCVYKVDPTMDRVFQLLILLVVLDEILRAFLAFTCHAPLEEDFQRAKECFCHVFGMAEEELFPPDFDFSSFCPGNRNMEEEEEDLQEDKDLEAGIEEHPKDTPITNSKMKRLDESSKRRMDDESSNRRHRRMNDDSSRPRGGGMDDTSRRRRQNMLFRDDGEIRSSSRRQTLRESTRSLLDQISAAFSMVSGSRMGSSRRLNNNTLRFEKASFGYAKKDGEIFKVVENLNMTLTIGEHYAIMGETGVGKSTFLKALSGLHEPLCGDIYFDGEPIDTTSVDWREKVAVVSQQSIFLNRSLRENMCYGLTANCNKSDEAIWNALEKVKMKDRIMTLPQGLDTIIEGNGNDFSGGQRQRLQIARLLLSSCPLILLDECTSALDPDTTEHVLDILQEFLVGRTMIMITHDVSTLVLAKHVLEMKPGGVVEFAKPKRVASIYSRINGRRKTELLRELTTPMSDISEISGIISEESDEEEETSSEAAGESNGGMLRMNDFSELSALTEARQEPENKRLHALEEAVESEEAADEKAIESESEEADHGESLEAAEAEVLAHEDQDPSNAFSC